MKRKINSIMLLGVIVIIAVVGVVIFISNKSITSNSYLTSKKENKSFESYTNEKYTKDSMSFDFIGFTGKWSFFKVESNKGNKITIKDNSNISKGKFYIVVLDSNYKKIAMKEANEKKDIEFVTQEEGKYLIRIIGKEASGHFEIKINSNDNIETSYKDFLQ